MAGIWQLRSTGCRCQRFCRAPARLAGDCAASEARPPAGTTELLLGLDGLIEGGLSF